MVKALGNNTFLDETRLVRMVILSAFVHFIAFVIFVFLPNFYSSPKIRIIPQYTPVSLIGPGELGGGGKSLVKPVSLPKQKINVAAQKPDLITKKIEQKAIEISKTEPKNKTEPKPITSPKQKEETQESRYQEQHAQAIENIRGRIGSGSPATKTEGVGGVGGIGVGVTRGGGGLEATEMQVYMSIVIDRIMEAWFLPPGLKEQAINQGLLTIIDIRIERDGKITLQAVEQNSGNSVYDDFAIKAIQKIQITSFPPLPAVYQGAYLDLVIKFIPSEVNS